MQDSVGSAHAQHARGLAAAAAGRSLVDTAFAAMFRYFQLFYSAIDNLFTGPPGGGMRHRASAAAIDGGGR